MRSYCCNVDARTALVNAYEERKLRNPNYSLRAYARDLGMDHPALSRTMRGVRNLSPRLVEGIGQKLGWGRDVINEALLALNCETVLRSLMNPGFRQDCRWIAIHTGPALDDVNRALHELLRRGALRMNSRTNWTLTQPEHA